jgi:SAM-dependent methyltransferase
VSPEVVDPARFEGWGGSFGDVAPHYEELAFSAGATGVLGERELDAVHAALAPLRGGLVLDVGAGSGRVSRALKAGGRSVVALDASSAMLRELARSAGATPRVVSRFGDRLPFNDGAFDAVVALRVLKYVAAPDRAIDEVARVLRPGGRAVLEWTNRRSVARVGYRGAPICFLDRTELRRLGRRAGLEVVATAPGSRLPHPVWRAARGRASKATLLGVEAGLATLLRPLPDPCGARSVITTFVKD